MMRSADKPIQMQASADATKQLRDLLVKTAKGEDQLFGARRGLVLDIETAPDPHALVLARRFKGVPRSSPLQAVVSASVLTFHERPGGLLCGYRLFSWHREEMSEEDILMNLHRHLEQVVDDAGTIATFNGKAHDLPVLQNRSLRWWMCDADSIDQIEAGKARHIDLMLELSAYGRARWPSLADACASVGFSLEGPVQIGRDTAIPRQTEKCELDVVGTCILLLYVLAHHSRSRKPLEQGLPALGRFLRSISSHRPHLARLAKSDLLSENAAAWGSRKAS